MLTTEIWLLPASTANSLFAWGVMIKEPCEPLLKSFPLPTPPMGTVATWVREPFDARLKTVIELGPTRLLFKTYTCFVVLCWAAAQARGFGPSSRARPDRSKTIMAKTTGDRRQVRRMRVTSSMLRLHLGRGSRNYSMDVPPQQMAALQMSTSIPHY